MDRKPTSDTALRQWDPQTERLCGSNVLVIGPKEQGGKSTILMDLWVRYLASTHQHLFVFCSADDHKSIRQYTMLTDRANIVHDPASVDNIVSWLTNRMHTRNAYSPNNAHSASGDQKEQEPTPVAIVFESSFLGLYARALFKRQAGRALFMNGRHIKATVLCAMLSTAELKPAIRHNLDYVIFTGGGLAHNEVQRLYQAFELPFANLMQFRQALDFFTSNHSVLVCKRIARPVQLFWWRAQPFGMSALLPPARVVVDLMIHLRDQGTTATIAVAAAAARQLRLVCPKSLR